MNRPLSEEHLADMTPQACAAGLHADWAVDSEHSHLCPWCRIAELEAERHTTNEALSDAAEALRAANTVAGLVAEYHVPASDGRWLAVRREPNGDRWAIYTAGRVLGDRKTWTGETWISIALATDSELWNYGSADAALAEATLLAENVPAVAR